MRKMTVRTQAVIRLDALRHNVENVRNRLHKGCQLMAVLKGDGYGHGIAGIYETLKASGVERYAVAVWEEGALLRSLGCQEPILILGAIGSQFRRIATARTLMDHGKGTSDLMKLCGLSSYPAQKTMDTARRFSAGFCATASELILETDHHMKTSFDSQERLLELLVLRLAQEARRG